MKHRPLTRADPCRKHIYVITQRKLEAERRDEWAFLQVQ